MNRDSEMQNKLLEQFVLKRVNNPTEFPAINQIKITKANSGCAEGELTVTEASLNPHKIVHGGCLYTLADTVCGAAAGSTGRFSVTMSSDINFLRPAKNCKIVYCSAFPEKIGRTVSVYRYEISGAGNVIATGTSTYYRVGEIEEAADDIKDAKASNEVE